MVNLNVEKKQVFNWKKILIIKLKEENYYEYKTYDLQINKRTI